MEKPGTLKVIDGVEHVMGEDGQWAPSNPNEALKLQAINAGKSLFSKVKGLMPSGGAPAAAAAEAPTGQTISQQIGNPF